MFGFKPRLPGPLQLGIESGGRRVVEKALYLRIGNRDGLETITSKAQSRGLFL